MRQLMFAAVLLGAAPSMACAGGPTVHWGPSRWEGCQRLLQTDNSEQLVRLGGAPMLVVSGSTCPAKIGRHFTVHGEIINPGEYRVGSGWHCMKRSGWCG